jgi:pimeloyl-ACP methyl ester carboxylesterase
LKIWPIIALLVIAVGGCSINQVDQDELSQSSLDKGVVFILPGIEGKGLLSDNLQTGLRQAGVPYGLAIYQWGRPVPVLGPILNQVDVVSNRAVADLLAERIVQYREAHPQGKVYLVGHSGGGGIAVFTAEALPAGTQVDGIVLLSASVSSLYNCDKALAHSRSGIVNFWSSGDVAFLVIGTSVAGNVDGLHGPAAGAVGFSRSVPGLYQVQWTPQMSGSGNLGGHMDTTGTQFVSQYVAPWLIANAWPAR